MRKIVLGLALATAMVAGAYAAPSAFAQQYPNVAGVTPFTAEANYMSRPGFLRYRYFQQTGEWISYPEAARIVREQGG